MRQIFEMPKTQGWTLITNIDLRSEDPAKAEELGTWVQIWRTPEGEEACLIQYMLNGELEF